MARRGSGWAWLAVLSGMALVATAGSTAEPFQPADVKLKGDWAVVVSMPGRKLPVTVLEVPRNELITVTAEKYDGLPVFNPRAGGWMKGARLKPLIAQETTTPNLLDPASLELRSGPEPTSEVFKRGADYDADLAWGTIGRLEGGRVREGQAVYATYRYAPQRLDAVVMTDGGRFELRKGEARTSAPRPAAIGKGEQRLANLWLPGRMERLSADQLFTVLEERYPEPPKPAQSVAERLVSKALKKLRSGEPLRILAWGDSVTVGTYVPDYQKNRWQEQFVTRLKERFPRAKIELITEAWGGRNTGSYLAEPPGSEHNYQEKVLAVKPDLVVSEFVNDGGLTPAQVEERYGKLLADFRGIGAEWIILTPHYVRPDWMGLTREKEIDQDPRPYVAGLRQFAPKHGVALADASLRYGRLWRQGIPYNTLMLNSINHPDARGMKLFADALMELFP